MPTRLLSVANLPGMPLGASFTHLLLGGIPRWYISAKPWILVGRMGIKFFGIGGSMDLSGQILTPIHSPALSATPSTHGSGFLTPRELGLHYRVKKNLGKEESVQVSGRFQNDLDHLLLNLHMWEFGGC